MNSDSRSVRCLFILINSCLQRPELQEAEHWLVLWHPVCSHQKNPEVSLMVRKEAFMLSCRPFFFKYLPSFLGDIEPAKTTQPAVATVSTSASRVMLWLTQDCNRLVSFLCRSLRSKRAHPAHCRAVRRRRGRWTNHRLPLSLLGRPMKLHLLLQRILSFRLPLAWQLIDLNLSPHDQQMPSLDQGLGEAALDSICKPAESCFFFKKKLTSLLMLHIHSISFSLLPAPVVDCEPQNVPNDPLPPTSPQSFPAGACPAEATPTPACTVDSQHDVPYFRAEIANETSGLTTLCVHWEAKVEDESIPEESEFTFFTFGISESTALPHRNPFVQ